MTRFILVCALASGLCAAACSPAEREAQAAPEAATPASPEAVGADWSSRMAADLQILRAETAREIPDVAATAQAAARISHVADEIEIASTDNPALAEAAATFEHEAITLAVVAPRTLEVVDLKILIDDFLAKAETFQAEHVAG